RSFRARRPYRNRQGRRGLGPRGRRARRRRDPAHEHGPGRDEGRLRPRADAHGRERRARAGRGLGRLRQRRAHGRGPHQRPRQRGARRVGLPLRRDPDSRGEGRAPGARRLRAASCRVGGRGRRGRRRSRPLMAIAMPEGLVFDANGLLPVVAQDRDSGDVLMLAWANAEAIARTAETGLAHFWSRSRKALWQKGETSGNALRVVEARADCDKDALLLLVEPAGPACHTGSRTCFGETSPTAAGMPFELARVVRERAQAAPEESYTARLLAKGQAAVLKKIGEEATEVVLAASAESDARLAEESADLLFHLLVALHQRGLPLARVMDELRRRRAASPAPKRSDA